MWKNCVLEKCMLGLEFSDRLTPNKLYLFISISRENHSVQATCLKASIARFNSSSVNSDCTMKRTLQIHSIMKKRRVGIPSPNLGWMGNFSSFSMYRARVSRTLCFSNSCNSIYSHSSSPSSHLQLTVLTRESSLLSPLPLSSSLQTMCFMGLTSAARTANFVFCRALSSFSWASLANRCSRSILPGSSPIILIPSLAAVASNGGRDAEKQ